MQLPPFSQLAGVARLRVAVSWRESIVRMIFKNDGGGANEGREGGGVGGVRVALALHASHVLRFQLVHNASRAMLQPFNVISSPEAPHLRCPASRVLFPNTTATRFRTIKNIYNASWAAPRRAFCGTLGYQSSKQNNKTSHPKPLPLSSLRGGRGIGTAPRTKTWNSTMAPCSQLQNATFHNCWKRLIYTWHRILKFSLPCVHR